MGVPMLADAGLKKMGPLTGCNGGVVSGPKSLKGPWVYGATRRPGICLCLFDDKFWVGK